MGAYLLGGVRAGAEVEATLAILRTGIGTRFSSVELEVGSGASEATGDLLLSVKVVPAGILRSIAPLLVAASLACYELTLQAIPSTALRTWQEGPAQLASPSSVLLVPSLVLAATGSGTPAALLFARTALDRRERKLVRRLRLDHGTPVDEVAPPRNHVLFRGDSKWFLALAAMFLAVHCVFWLSEIGEPGLSGALVLPYVILLFLAMAADLVWEFACDKVYQSLNPYMARRVAQARLASLISGIFVFPLAFYALTSLFQGVIFALIQNQSILPNIGRGKKISAEGVTFIGAAGESDGGQKLWNNGAFAADFAKHFFAARVVAVLLTLLALAAIVMYLFALRYSKLLRISSAVREIPTSAGEIPPLRLSSLEWRNPRAVNVAIIAQWALVLLVNLAGALVTVLWVLWLAGADPTRPSIGWITPSSTFVWYNASIVGVFGRGLGASISYTLMIGLFGPGLLWLLAWFYSVIKWVAQLVLLLVPRRRSVRPPGHVEQLCRDLSGRLGIASPAVRAVGRLKYPDTIPVLPFPRFCAIRVPKRLIDTMPASQLRVVVAHELAHVARHARKLWLVEVLSRASLVGPILLVLLLENIQMELDADRVSLELTQDYTAVYETLNELKQETLYGDGAEAALPAAETGGRVPRGIPAWVPSTLVAFFTSDSDWVVKHAVIEKRLMSLAAYNPTGEKEVSPQ